MSEWLSPIESNHNWQIMSAVAAKRPLHKNPQYFQHDDCPPFYTDAILTFDVKMCPFCGTKKYENPGTG